MTNERITKMKIFIDAAHGGECFGVKQTSYMNSPDSSFSVGNNNRKMADYLFQVMSSMDFEMAAINIMGWCLMDIPDIDRANFVNSLCDDGDVYIRIGTGQIGDGKRWQNTNRGIVVNHYETMFNEDHLSSLLGDFICDGLTAVDWIPSFERYSSSELMLSVGCMALDITAGFHDNKLDLEWMRGPSFTNLAYHIACKIKEIEMGLVEL